MDPPADRSFQPAPHRRANRQQRKACDLCRRRKVRCDIVDRPGGPCSVCERSEIECRYVFSTISPDNGVSLVLNMQGLPLNGLNRIVNYRMSAVPAFIP